MLWYGDAEAKVIASESTPIQRPHLCAFVTFIVSIVSMTSKLTLLYIRGDHGSGVDSDRIQRFSFEPGPEVKNLLKTGPGFPSRPVSYTGS